MPLKLVFTIVHYTKVDFYSQIYSFAGSHESRIKAASSSILFATKSIRFAIPLKSSSVSHPACVSISSILVLNSFKDCVHSIIFKQLYWFNFHINLPFNLSIFNSFAILLLVYNMTIPKTVFCLKKPRL